MKLFDAIERLVLLALSVPVLVIILDTVFRFFNARVDNPVVARIRVVQDAVTPQIVESMFPAQDYYQTALLALAVYGLLVLAVVMIFRMITGIAARAAAPDS
jgi:hypothetical protein